MSMWLSVCSWVESGIVEIRPGVIGDVDEIDRLLRLLAGSLADSPGDLEHHGSTAKTLGRDGFGDRPLFSTMLARPVEGGAAVGLCIYLPDYSTVRGCAGVYILDLIVAPEWQSRGVGLDLLRAVAEVGSRRWNADYLILSVAAQNVRAQQFYRRHGLIVDEKSKVMTLEGLGSLLGR